MRFLPKNATFKTIDIDYVPVVPIHRRQCPTCLDPMRLSYCWKSSERVIHYMFVCHCGSGSKVKLMHFRINSRGGLEG
jgi:hypothetical protein